MTENGKGPARGYSWAPFQPGHTITLRHGARSPRTVQPLADRIATGLAEVAPWTTSLAFAPTVAAWSYVEAQAQLLRAWFNERGFVNDEGEPLPGTALLDKVETRASRLRSELGLNPVALGGLLKVAASVAQATGDEDALKALKAEGRAILEARWAELEAGDKSNDRDDQEVEGDG